MQHVPLAQTLLALLLLHGSCQRTWAQSGYNYARPELASGAGNVPAGVGLRTNLLPGAYPTGAVGTAPATATTAYGGFAGQPASTYTPSAVAQGQTAFGAPVSAGGGGVGGLKRPIASAGAAAQQTRPVGSTYGQYTPGATRLTTGTGAGGGLVDNDYSEGDYSAIPGVPGVDYPVYAQVPRTNFDCAQQPLPGYYADIEAQCQVFHICALNRTYSFLCPNGTVFSQETLVCVWWNQYDCGTAPSLYANNAFIYDYEQRGGGGASAANANPNLNAGYQLGRVQPSNTARTPSNAGVYGSAAGLRSTVVPQSTGGGGTGGAAGYIGANAATRGYTPSPTVASGGQFGAVLRPGGVVPTAVGNALIQDTSNTISAAGQPTSANREYLPPAGGRRN